MLIKPFEAKQRHELTQSIQEESDKECKHKKYYQEILGIKPFLKI